MVSVVEIFYSLQGEGLDSGEPSIFVRLGGCNMICEGYGCQTLSPKDGSLLTGCDTIRAVASAHYKDQWHRYDGAGLCALLDDFVKSLNLSFRPAIVLTGGEPMLWFGNPDFLTFAHHLQRFGYKVSVETNGTIPLQDHWDPVYRTFFYVVAVKLAHTKEPEEKRINPQAIEAFLATPRPFFKFVVSQKSLDDDRNQIRKLSQDFPSLPVVCMPMGNTMEALNTHAKEVFEVCKEEGWRYSDRLQIRIYNSREGV